MCRILGYLGQPVVLKRLLYEPEHSLLVQSYQPKEMTSGVVNADGYGIGWYDPARGIDPFVYRHTLPIWGDANLPHLSRYIESGTILGCVRSATAGQPVDLSNCQPFQCDRWLGVHNGFIEQFRQTLY
ncbi:MAG: class II glutamine amidotransferase, partial [Coleofasciculaceae cyanobacterium SM2_3_26]|nr:class II glutamine amidotransferase [Coleofasciculaceae cyanobacterium SM2_3_26]